MCSYVRKRIVVLLPLVILSACGGGGGGDSSGNDPSDVSNQAPEFVAISEILTDENKSDILMTLSANDPDGDQISFSLTGGLDQSRFLIDNGNQLRFGFTPDFENPTDSDKDNVYQVEVQASDGKGGKASQSFLVTVANVNDGAPAFSSSSQVTVQEGFEGVFYTAVAQDPDRDTVAYSLGGTDAALFSIGAASGELSFNNAPNFESPADSNKDNRYQLSISAADSEGAKNQLALEIAVTDLTLPSVRFDFPTGGANMGGKMSSISLTARSVDLESGASTSAQLATITIDGQSPIQNTDIPSLWHLDTSLTGSWDSYSLSAQFVSGETVASNHHINNEQLIQWPVGVSYDNFYRVEYFADMSLASIFEVSGARRVISGPNIGSGPALNPIDMEQNFPLIRSNPDNDYLIVLNKDGSITSVQLKTGDRTQLTTWIPADLNALILTPSGYDAYTTRATGSYGEIIKFDLSSGDYTVISSSSSWLPVGSGPGLQTPTGIRLDPDNQQLYVADEGSDSILKVDIATGDRVTISGNGVGGGVNFAQPMDLVLSEDGSRIFVANGGGQNVLAVDIASGDRSVVTDWDRGEGLSLVNPWSINWSADSNRLLVSGVLYDPALVSVDIDTGNRSDISSNHVGTGPSSTWSQLDYDVSTNTLYAVSASDSSVAAVNLENGNRTIVSDPYNGTGSSIHSPVDILVDGAEQRAFIFDSHAKQLAKVDITSGDRETISATWLGSGPNIESVSAMALDLANNRIVLLESSTPSLMSIDLDTGDREVISDNGTGSGSDFHIPKGLALDIANNRAFVSNYGDGSITGVDLASGDRATLVALLDGGTVGEELPKDLALDHNGNQLLVGTASGNLVAINLEDLSQSTLPNGRSCDELTPSNCQGLPVTSFSPMAIDPESNRLFVHDGGGDGPGGIVVVDLRSGQRALASK